MENFNIENAKTRFFESKEHYLNFRQAWKDFHNNRDHMRSFTYKDWKGKEHTGEVAVLTSSHYLLYNLLREYGVQYGFTEHGENGWDACYWAAVDILRRAKDLQDVNNEWKYRRESARKDIEDLLLPFGGHVSHETLRDVGEWLNIMIFNNQNFPQFEIEEWKDIKESEKLSLKQKLAKRFA